MLVRQIALVADGVDIDVAEILRVSSALQKQVTRDFAPTWELSATVDVFAREQDIPLGYWAVKIVEDVEGAPGSHLDRNGQPYSLVEAGDSWSLTASHEILEMLADPFGNRLIAGQSPLAGQGRVEFLVEVCDPSEAAENAYTVNDVLVSDFYTPRYFDPVASSEVRYSFSGKITKPRQVLPGGYLSWHEPSSDSWFQLDFSGAELRASDLGHLERKNGSLREMIDAKTPQTQLLSKLPPDTPQLKGAIAAAELAQRASSARADALRADIEEVKQRAQR